MSVLLIAEHDNSNLKTFTLNAISAASKIDEDIHVLVAGFECESVSKEAASSISMTVLKQAKLENTPIGDNFSCHDTESVKNVNDNGMWGNDRALMQGQFHKIYIQRHENVSLPSSSPSYLYLTSWHPGEYPVCGHLWLHRLVGPVHCRGADSTP